MSCDRYITAISDHACGADLDPATASHIEECASCRDQLAEQRRAMQGLDADLQHLVAIELSPGFASGVHARIEAARRSSGWLWWSLAGSTAAAAAIALYVGTTPTPTIMPLPPAPAVSTPAPIVAASIDPALVEVSGPRPARAAKTAHRRSAPELEVILPPNRLEAVSRFLVLSRKGVLDTESLAGAGVALMPPTELTVSPLAIEPLAGYVEISAGPGLDGRGLQ